MLPVNARTHRKRRSSSKGLEQEINFERERERKSNRIIGGWTPCIGEDHARTRPEIQGECGFAPTSYAYEIEEIRKVIAAKSAEIRKKEQDRSEELVKIRISVANCRQRLKNLDDKWARSSSQIETQMADLEEPRVYP